MPIIEFDSPLELIGYLIAMLIIIWGIDRYNKKGGR